MKPAYIAALLRLVYDHDGTQPVGPRGLPTVATKALTKAGLLDVDAEASVTAVFAVTSVRDLGGGPGGWTASSRPAGTRSRTQRFAHPSTAARELLLRAEADQRPKRARKARRPTPTTAHIHDDDDAVAPPSTSRAEPLPPPQSTVPPGKPVQDALGADLTDADIEAFGPGPRHREAEPARGRKKRGSPDRLVDLLLESTGPAKVPDPLALHSQATRFWPRYRPWNGILILAQLPEATWVENARVWREQWGAVPRPDARPIVISLPGGPVGYVYDRSQVEPGPGSCWLPDADYFARTDLDAAPALLERLTTAAMADGVRVVKSQLGSILGGCIETTSARVTQPVEVRVDGKRAMVDVPVEFDCSLNSATSAESQLATLAHELGHLYCDHLGQPRRATGSPWDAREDVPPRGTPAREAEAEAVELLVMARLDPEGSYLHRLAQHPGNEDHPPEPALRAVTTAVERILEMATGTQH